MKILSIRSHRPFSFFLTVLAFLCVLCGESPAQEFKTLHDGVEYAEVTREISGLKVNMNLLRLDLKKVRLDVHHAMDAAIGTEKTSSIAARHGAVAAINAGFFRLDKSNFLGDPAGVLKLDGEIISESITDRVALGVINGKKRTEAFIARVKARACVGYYLNGTERLDGVDREQKDNEIILYTPEMKASPLQTEHTEIVFTECKYGCKMAKVVRTQGGTVVPDDGYVVSFGERSDKEFMINYLKRREGSELKERAIFFGFIQVPDKKVEKKFVKAEHIVGGVPQLIKNGKVDITWEQEKASKSFVETRHPRTAVAKLKDGKFLMIAVDGRSESSGGIGLYDLANYLLELGAVDAMNLDGGGSTTMFLDGKVVNHPSDKEGERKVSDAILVTLRKKK